MLPLLFPQNCKTPSSCWNPCLCLLFHCEDQSDQSNQKRICTFCVIYPLRFPFKKGCVAQLPGMCVADSFQLLMISVSTSAFNLRPCAFWVTPSEWHSKVVGKDPSISIQGGTPLMSDLNSGAGLAQIVSSIAEVYNITDGFPDACLFLLWESPPQ